MCLRRLRLVATVLALQSALATPAQASPALLMNSQMLLLFQSVTSPNLCIIYSYDHNGNILSKNNQLYGTTATWGSSTYACFDWTPA